MATSTKDAWSFLRKVVMWISAYLSLTCDSRQSQLFSSLCLIWDDFTKQIVLGSHHKGAFWRERNDLGSNRLQARPTSKETSGVAGRLCLDHSAQRHIWNKNENCAIICTWITQFVTYSYKIVKTIRILLNRPLLLFLTVKHSC